MVSATGPSSAPETYESKLARMANGQHVTFTGSQFLRYVMEKQGITAEQLAPKLGYDLERMDREMRVGLLHDNTAARMAHMTNMEPESGTAFWRQETFSPDSADSVTIDMDRDASEIKYD